MSAGGGRRGVGPAVFWIVGGGCYGAFYARSLARAIDRGRLADARVRVVDRDPKCRVAGLPPRPERTLVRADWREGLDRALAEARRGRERHFLVPAPLTPHLFATGLARTLAESHAVAREAPALLPETPFARHGPEASFLVSYAEWRCPVHCIEPWICPATRQPRSWDVTRGLVEYARALRGFDDEPLEGPLIARVSTLVEGVGVTPLADWLRAAERLRRRFARSPGRALVATVSGCHGAGHLLRLTPRPAEGPRTETGGGEKARARA